METKLRQAVGDGESFRVYYQPVVHLKTGLLSGFEALVRLRRPDGSLVPPIDFIPSPSRPASSLASAAGCWPKPAGRCAPGSNATPTTRRCRSR